MKKYFLYVFFIVTAYFAVACKEKINEGINQTKQPIPKIVGCSVSEGAYVNISTNKITIRYSTAINLVDKEKVTLVNDLSQAIPFELQAANVNLNIKLAEPLVYNRSYTLTVSSGTVCGANKGEVVIEPYSLSFFSEKKMLPIESFDIDETVTHPNPSPEVVKLYDYFKSIFGKKSLSGAMAKYTVQLNEAEWMKENTGKSPAIACFDLMNATRLDYLTWGDPPYSEMMENAKKWHADGGLVSIMWHWRDPLRKTDAFYSMNTNNDPRTNFNVSKVHDPNSAEYKAMIEDIDFIAKYLIELQDAGIPILWRPLHEAQGGWFWWGAKKAEDAVALWRLMYDRLHNVHKLNNLIWVWTITQKDGAQDWYPGHDVVDLVGADVYQTNPSHNSYKSYFDFVAAVSEGRKLVALSECGAIPKAENMQSTDTWLYFMPWYGDFTQSDDSNGAKFLTELFKSDFVITRDELTY